MIKLRIIQIEILCSFIWRKENNIIIRNRNEKWNDGDKWKSVFFLTWKSLIHQNNFFYIVDIYYSETNVINFCSTSNALYSLLLFIHLIKKKHEIKYLCVCHNRHQTHSILFYWCTQFSQMTLFITNNIYFKCRLSMTSSKN